MLLSRNSEYHFLDSLHIDSGTEHYPFRRNPQMLEVRLRPKPGLILKIDFKVNRHQRPASLGQSWLPTLSACGIQTLALVSSLDIVWAVLLHTVIC